MITDNLNMLKTAITDIIAYLDLDEHNREQAILAVIDVFTFDEAQNNDVTNYLLPALRGDIYNLGGPPIGELMGSERNRFREVMATVHTMIMSEPQ